jgi:hypothetical protein
MELQGDVGQIEGRIGLFGDSTNTVCIERTIGSEIILDALDGTLR